MAAVSASRNLRGPSQAGIGRCPCIAPRDPRAQARQASDARQRVHGSTEGSMQAQAIDQALRQATAAQQVPGVVAMAATDQGVVYEGAAGVRELGKSTAMTADSVFWIAS